MLAFALSSNLTYALVGSLLRQWLSQGARLLWFNRVIGGAAAGHRGVDDRRMTPRPHDEARGLWFGLLGVTIFAMTLPMTRLAVGPAGDPQLPPLFVTAGRAAFAGLLSIGYLLLTRAPRPRREHLPDLAVCAAGTVIGFPLFLALALREVDAMHAAVITGVLPLGTALAAALAFRQRPVQWLLAVRDAGLRAGARLCGAARQRPAERRRTACCCSPWRRRRSAMCRGARLSAQMSAERVICWVLVLSLPFTLPVAWASWPTQAARASAWLGFGYVSVFSMWLGFFAWYRGLALGGTVRVSQVATGAALLRAALCGAGAGARACRHRPCCFRSPSSPPCSSANTLPTDRVAAPAR
jgi:drug/metabolite transporter (DMT)-like permease